jgi:hypothetical protein
VEARLLTNDTKRNRPFDRAATVVSPLVAPSFFFPFAPATLLMPPDQSAVRPFSAAETDATTAAGCLLHRGAFTILTRLYTTMDIWALFALLSQQVDQQPLIHFTRSLAHAIVANPHRCPPSTIRAVRPVPAPSQRAPIINDTKPASSTRSL